MKGVYCCIFFVLLTISVYAQPPFTSTTSGNWNTGAAWGRAGNVAGTDYPIAGQSATIATGTTVTVPTGTFAVGNLTIENNNTAILNVNGALEVNGAITGGTTRGFLNVNTTGRLILNNGATVQAAWTRLFIKSSGALEMNYSTGGTVPACTYETGSILRFTGYTSATATTPTFESGITLQNVEWNCTSQGNDIFFNGTMPNLSGYLKVISTGPLPWYLVLTSSAAYTATIAGNLEVSNGGHLVLTDGAGAATVTVNGNVSVITTGSQLDLKQSTGIGTLNVKGNFTLTNGTIGTFGAGGGELVFNGTALQTFSRTGGTISAAVNYTVFDFSLLDLGVNALTGAGKITLNNNSTLYVASTDVSGAIQLSPTSAGNIQVSGIRTYSSSSNIVYNGAAAQKLGNGFPSNVNLEIANTNGVTNNNVGTTNFVGNLTLTTGALHIGSSNTLNIQSNFFTTLNGSIGGDATSNLTFSGSGTLNTLRFASTKELLNNLTVSRIAELVLGSNLTVSGTIDLSGGNLDFSGQTLTMNGGSIITSANGLKSNSTSNLTFGGSTFTGSIPFSGAGNQLNTLTFATNGGAYTWNSGVTVNTSVFLTAGTLTHTSGITMAANSTIFKGAGSITSSSPVAATSYNVTYTGTGNTGLELPTTATALNNLTITSSGTVTLASTGITVNGDLLISGGTFAAEANNFTMKGANWTISGGVFTPGTGTVSFSGTTAIGGTGTTSFNNLTVTGTGILTLPSNTMNISSNLANDGIINRGTGTVAFAGTTSVTGTGTTSFNNVVVNATSSLTAPSGTLNIAADFTNNGTFTNNSGTINFNGTSSVIGTVNFGHVTISNILNAPAALNIAGNFTNNNTFNRGTGTVVFNGSSIQSIQGSAITDFNNISVTNTAPPVGVQVQSNANLRGVLTLAASSVFDADGSVGTSIFTLVSSGDSPTVDAGIAALPTGASVTGNVTVQRYMAIEGATSRIYRYITSPVQTPAVSQIQAEIPVTGSFTGSSSCSGCTTSQSMFSYNESIITGDLNTGYVDFPDAANTETLAAGRGYTIFVRGNIAPVSTAGTARWSVRNPINSGAISFPVSFTSSGNVNNDGWNLVGNPYPSTIDWNAASGWTKSTSISGTIYLRDNAIGGAYATWNGTAGVNGGSRNIAMGQAFWVKSDGSAATSLSANESVKTAGTQTTFFRVATPSDILRITLRQGNVRDESVIHFREDATINYDHHADAYKLKNEIFNLSTTTDNLKLAINSLPLLTCGTTVKLDISDVAPGTYQIEFSEFESFGNEIEISVYDVYTNTRINPRVNSSYAFEVTADSLSFGNKRFSVSFSNIKPVDVQLTAPAQVCQDQQAFIGIANSENFVTYSVYRNGNVIAGPISGNGGALQISIDASKLVSGDNGFILQYSPANCSSMISSQQVNIKSLDLPSITAVNGDHCGSGSVSLSASGAEEGNYRWYETETDNIAISGASAGTYSTPVLNKSKTYYVSAVNALGCEGARKPVEAVVHQYDEVTISLDAGLNGLTSSHETGNQWYFNGEAIPGAIGKTVEAGETGLYEVEVKINGCISRAGREMIILGLENDPGKGYGFFPNPVKDKLTIELNRADVPAKGMVYTSSGQPLGVIEFKPSGQKLKGEYDFADHATGMYLIRILQGNKVINYKVIKK